MSSTISHQIKNRKVAQDVFITPKELAILQITKTQEIINKCLKKTYSRGTINWYDPFRNSGNYYNNFPGGHKLWAEILEGKDFFKDSVWYGNRLATACVSNPPYSLTDKILENLTEHYGILNCISLLLPDHAITPRRLEKMEKAGWRLVFQEKCKVYKWYGITSMCIWLKTAQVKKPYDECMIMSYNRKVWRLDEESIEAHQEFNRKMAAKEKARKVLKNLTN